MTDLAWRQFSKADFPLLAWFREHGWPAAPDLSILPPTGMVIERAGEPLCIGFLYLSNSPLGWVDWIATRPGLPVRESLRVLEYFMERLREAAKGSGVAKIIHLSRPKSARVFEKKLGFKKTEDLSVLVCEV